MNVNHAQIHYHTDFFPKANNGFFQTGRERLVVRAEFAQNPIGQETRLMAFTATCRGQRCLGFAIEALKITLFPFFILERTFKLVELAADRLIRVNLCCMIIAISILIITPPALCFAFGACILITATLLPLTLAVATIFELIRIAHYAKTHTTIQVEGRKYYVHTQKYRRELQNTFQIDNRDLSSPDYKNMQTLLGLFEQEGLPSQRTVDRLRAAENLRMRRLDGPLSKAFERNNYLGVINFINRGANPNLIFSVAPDGKSREFGCLFALVSKRLENDKENEHLTALYELLCERIPEELQLTRLLEEVHPPLLPEHTHKTSARGFNLAKARKWAREAPEIANEAYAILTVAKATDLQKIYLKSDTVDPNNLLLDTLGLMQYEIGTALALAHSRFPDEFPNGGEITIYLPQEYDYAKPDPQTKSARNT